MDSKFSVAMRALRKLMEERGEDHIRSQASWNLQQDISEYLDDEPFHMCEISEATINNARRRILEEME